MTNNKGKIKVIDLFCGIGGFSYGFEMTHKFEVIAGADIWDVALSTFKVNHKNTLLINEDLTTMDEHYWDSYKGVADVIIAGPPCQGFSMSGRRKKNDNRNSLFKEIVRITSIIQPKYVVIENVVGLLSMTNDEGYDIKKLINDEFNALGYNVSYKVLNAAEYGVPQARHRVVFLISKKYPLVFPKPLLTTNDFITVGDALGNIDPDGITYLSPITEYQQLMKGDSNIITNHERRTSNELVTLRMSHIPEGGNWKDIPIELGTGGGIHSNAYKRLDSSKPSITIKHAAKAMIIHPWRNRILSIREVARLQSFDDNFILKGSISDQHQQLANAVPPLLGKAIAEQIYSNLQDNKSSNLTFVDLFCGMGGFRLAFEHFGCECVFSSDIDDYACKTYELNFKENPKNDITKTEARVIPDFDILCAGFPCQPFSIAGKRLGFEDTRGTLFFDVARIIKEKKPKAILLENVKGITNHNNGTTIKVIYNTLIDLGYELRWEILNAKDYGVPQNRERWYCIGIRNDINHSRIIFPQKKALSLTLSDIIHENVSSKYICSSTCSQNIDKFIKLKNIKIERDTLAYEIRPSRCQFSKDGISPCLTAKMGTGGNNVPVVVKQNRKLTEEECLQIMGFPKTYKIFSGSQTYKQIGNSVAVPVLIELAGCVLEILGGVVNEDNW